MKEKLKEIQKDIPIEEGSLATYVGLIEVQEEAKGFYAEKFRDIDVEKVQEGFKEGKPAFLSLPLEISEEDIEKAYAAVTGYLSESLPETREPIARIEESRKAGELRLKELSDALFAGDEEHVHGVAERVGVDPEILEAVIAWSLQPIFQALSDAVSSKVDFSTWTSGRCPVCGGPTKLEYVDAGGHAHLRCQFCGTEWGYPEGKCPYCGNSDRKTVVEIPVKGEDKFKLMVCYKCGGYWKVVDERVVGEGVPRELYDIWSFRLDLLATGGER